MFQDFLDYLKYFHQLQYYLLKDKEEIDTIKKRIGIATNNVAEYLGLIEALKYCVENNIMEVDIYLDSLLVVQQVNLEYKVKSKKLQEYYNKALNLINEIDTGRE